MNVDSLPIEFVNRMKSDLGPDFNMFMESFEEDKISAFRINPLKFQGEIPFETSGQVKWCSTGYYYDDTVVKPGNMPIHHAGGIYIQDASAMGPVELLDVKPGERVLDLCAAPGGKSTQIAGKLMNKGILVCNEPMPQRAKILSENIERLGVSCAVVVSEYPEKLVVKFPFYFDAILVDAPCSGEGMFRKNPDAIKEWSMDNVRACADRQDRILSCAKMMLKPGGRIVYSTCTFAKQEDEETVERFIKLNPEFTLVEQKRIWPHLDRGEGHFMALLKNNNGEESNKEGNTIQQAVENALKSKALQDYVEFCKTNLNDFKLSNTYLNGDLIYELPDMCPDFSKIHVLRAGIFMGSLKKNRFEPSHALAMCLNESQAKRFIRLNHDCEEIEKYIRGESFNYEAENGWTLITCNGISLGWGKVTGNVVKNHYPKGLRKLTY